MMTDREQTANGSRCRIGSARIGGGSGNGSSSGSDGCNGSGIQKPGVPFRTIRNSIRTGDTLLFRGSDAVSDAITEVEQHYDGVDSFSHSGMAMWASDFPATSVVRRPGDQGRLYVLESTASGRFIDGVPAITDDRGHLGVQLRDLDMVVDAYDANPKTRLAWLPLQDARRPAISQQALDATVCKYLGTAYDASCIDMSAAAIPLMRMVRDNRCIRCLRDKLCGLCCCGARPSSWLFCSELVASIYVDWGVFPETVVPGNVMPTDFLPKGFDASETSALVAQSQVPSAAIIETVDSDKQVPWVFREVVRYHS